MAIKTYKVNDFWLDIDKENHVDIESTDGVITSVKNNGEDIGGGGSSDFSTAEVKIAVPDTTKLFIPTINNGEPFAGVFPFPNIGDDEVGTVDVVLYKGSAFALWTGNVGLTISGNIELLQQGMYKITGDCEIKASIS